MTKVINLFGGSGLGKSTTAAHLFAEMKFRGLHVELVREYVKELAWQGRKITQGDQPKIFAEQSRREQELYGKVDFIVTDSPLLLSPIYERVYNGFSAVEPDVLNFLDAARMAGVEHLNYILERHKPFDPRGRYETAEKAKEIDGIVRKYLRDQGLVTLTVTVEDRERANAILATIPGIGQAVA